MLKGGDHISEVKGKKKKKMIRKKKRREEIEKTENGSFIPVRSGFQTPPAKRESAKRDWVLPAVET
jgi:hypothetical protein